MIEVLYGGAISTKVVEQEIGNVLRLELEHSHGSKQVAFLTFGQTLRLFHALGDVLVASAAAKEDGQWEL